eukprot:EG_transcript_20169
MASPPLPLALPPPLCHPPSTSSSAGSLKRSTLSASADPALILAMCGSQKLQEKARAPLELKCQLPVHEGAGSSQPAVFCLPHQSGSNLPSEPCISHERRGRFLLPTRNDQCMSFFGFPRRGSGFWMVGRFLADSQSPSHTHTHNIFPKKMSPDGFLGACPRLVAKAHCTQTTEENWH